MGKQLSPLEKEFLIKTYRAKTEVKLSDFCQMNDVSETSMRKWIKQYEAGGIEGLSRAGEMGDVLPEGIDRTEENYKREILKRRIENEKKKIETLNFASLFFIYLSHLILLMLKMRCLPSSSFIFSKPDDKNVLSYQYSVSRPLYLFSFTSSSTYVTSSFNNSSPP